MNNNPGYPSQQQPGYPPQQPGYPPQQPGYPPQQPGYPPQQPGHMPRNPGYPPQQSGYPPQQPGYPPQQPGHMPRNPGYPPQQPGYPPQQPGYPPQQPGHMPRNPGLSPLNQNYSSQNPYHTPTAPNISNVIPGAVNPPQNTTQGWDERSYFKNLFDEMDHNHDGEISGQELHAALRKGQANSEFDPYTVGELIKKYDTSRNGEINFNEFYQLFTDINNMFNDFLDVDLDFSGSVDSKELSHALQRKGYNFSQDFYNFLFYELSKYSRKQTISFDIYVRIITKIDRFKFDFKNMPQNRNNPNINPAQFEQFVRQYIFY